MRVIGKKRSQIAGVMPQTNFEALKKIRGIAKEYTVTK